MTQAIAAQGVQLQRISTVIPELVNLTGPSISLDTADVTAHDGSGWREFVATLLSGGTITAVFNWVPDDTQQAALFTDMVAKTLQTFVIDPPGTTSNFGFSAHITAHEVVLNVDAVMVLNVTLQISGAVTFA